jgi:hypothetical protein
MPSAIRERLASNPSIAFDCARHTTPAMILVQRSWRRAPDRFSAFRLLAPLQSFDPLG